MLGIFFIHVHALAPILGPEMMRDGMDWSRITDENRKTLRRIVAVLLALADLCERARHKSPAVRRLVLGLLRPGEAVARDYLAGLTGRAGQVDPTAIRGDDGAAEAIRLAMSFRTLAVALSALPSGVFTSRRFAIAHARYGMPAALGALAGCRVPLMAVERRDSS